MTPLSRSRVEPVAVIIDTRENEPYGFDPRLVAAERRALPAGDYSLRGLETAVAVERKSLDDFVSTVVHARRRFQAELRKLRGYPAACVVVEASLADIVLQRYRSRAHPSAVLGSALSILLDCRVPVIFCGDRQLACHFTQTFLVAAGRRWQQ